MRILVLTFYFKPDLSAGSFRATALVEALRGLAPAGSEIEVVTTIPNRYHSFSVGSEGVATQETESGVSVTRIPVPGHKSGFADQARAFLAFARGAMAQTRGRHYDVIFATSSRLMTGALAARISRRGGAPLYLDIRDIFVETINDVLPVSSAWITKRVFALIERYTVNSATHTNLVSRGFEPYFSTRYPGREFSFLSNGIDEEFLVDASSDLPPSDRHDRRRPLKILYAGNVGEGQGLDVVLPALACEMRSEARFTVIGDGGRRTALEQALRSASADNVEILPPIRREELVKAYESADVLLLHLNNYRAFERVLPSKIFEYAATGKPIWAGVAGYSAEFIRSEIANAAIFRPCDVADALRAFAELRLEDQQRQEFVNKYSRRRLSRELAAGILRVAGTHG